VDIEDPGFRIGPCEEMLFVGSCFADSIGQRFAEEGFPVTVNPFGTMYNPASILHTIERLGDTTCQTAFLTLGTNRVYRLKETGDIVDNCQKRPQSLFTEEQLSVEECACYLRRAIALLRQKNPGVRIVLTISPIRYRKYGYHGSQLSKATLLLAASRVLEEGGEAREARGIRNPRDPRNPRGPRDPRDSRASSAPSYLGLPASLAYFPAYELVCDELRDYRFYAPDMLHPSAQAVDYIWERLVETYFSPEARTFLDEWRPVRQALGHKPFNADSPEYLRFMEQTRARLSALQQKYPLLKKYEL